MLSNQGGARVILDDNEVVHKSGSKIVPCEEDAMKLVQQYTDVPIPVVYLSGYSPDHGFLAMSLVPGITLDSCWSSLDKQTKERLCRETWALISKIREIPKPPKLNHIFQCSADGSPTHDVLIEDLENPRRPILSDEALRGRICERYHHYNGRKHTEKLPSFLPRSDVSVFTHGDIAPRNIMVMQVDQAYTITSIIDWERTGWYPDYWEYANIMKPSKDTDWQEWMKFTAVQTPDISGIQAARGVLF